MSRIGWRAATGLAAVLLLAGCSADGSKEPEVDPDSLAGALAQAKEAGVDQSQIDVLAQGEVTFADYESAMDRALTCMRDGRISIGQRSVERQDGQDVVYYTFTQGALSEDEALKVHDDCYEKYARFVDDYWQTGSPDAVAFQERQAEALYDPLLECLESKGVDHPDDASFSELVVTAAKQLDIDESKYCLDEIGYHEWDG